MSFRPTLILFKNSQKSISLKKPPSKVKGSNQWLSRQLRDPYVKKRHQQLVHGAQYRSRAAFKLIEMDQKYVVIPKIITDLGERINRRAPVIIDLGAAPGGWSQVVANKLGLRPPQMFEGREAEYETDVIDHKVYQSPGEWGNWNAPLPHEKHTTERPTIIALDLQEMQPVVGVQSLELSFLDPGAGSIIAGMIPTSETRVKPEVDLILSDMSPRITGNRVHDTQASMKLCEAVFEFALRHLRHHDKGRGHGLVVGGSLVLKHFVCQETQEFRKQKLEHVFRKVYFSKPPASRASSSEGYWVCKDFL